MTKQIRDSVDQDEIDFDTKQGRFSPYQESFDEQFEEVFGPSEKKCGTWVGDKDGFQVLIEDKPITSIFLDDVEDVGPEPIRSKGPKIVNGKEVIIDFKERYGK